MREAKPPGMPVVTAAHYLPGVTKLRLCFFFFMWGSGGTASPSEGGPVLGRDLPNIHKSLPAMLGLGYCKGPQAG